MKLINLNIAKKNNSKLKKMNVQINEECLKNEKNFKDENENENENENVKD